MKTNNLFFWLSILSVLCISCKGKDGAPGPAGASSNLYQEWVYKEGFVRGTFDGNLIDGSSFSYDMDFQGNDLVTDNSYFVVSPTVTNIAINKIYSGEGEVLESGSFQIYFAVSSLSDLSTPIVNNMFIGFSKVLGPNYYHTPGYTYYHSFPDGRTATVSGLVYNSTTGILTGNYTYSAPAIPGAGNLSIVNGTFSTKLARRAARMAAQ